MVNGGKCGWGNKHWTVSDKVGEVEGVGAGAPCDASNTNTGKPAKYKLCATLFVVVAE